MPTATAAACRNLILLLLAVLIVLLLPVGAQAATWYVASDTGSDGTGDGTEGNPYQTITKAQTACASGDTIRIYNGTYTEAITVSVDTICFVGSSRDSTILNADFGVAFTLEDRYGVTIRNLKIISVAYGIVLNHAPRTSADSVWILNPLVNAILMQQIDSQGEFFSSFTNCRFEGAGQSQVVVEGVGSDSLTWSGNEFINGDMNGLFLDQSSFHTITNNLFDGLDGHGVCYGAGHTITGNIFRNSRNAGSAALLLWAEGSYAANNLFDSNVGPAITLEDATNARIEANTLKNSGDYALSFTSSSANCTVTRNNIIPRDNKGCQNSATAGSTFDISRNWWGTADSAAITGYMAGTTSELGWSSWRLGEVDTRVGEDTIAPRPPDTVVVSESTASTCRITWTTVTFNEDGSACGDLAGYRIYRSQRRDTSLWVERGITGPATTTFTDSGLTKDTGYYYRVTAFDNHATWPNESFYSDSIVTCTPAATAYAGPTWYVADTGSDAFGSGASDSPFKTIAKALSRTAVGDTVRIYAGTFPATDTLFIDTASVTIAGADSATTIIDLQDSTVAQYRSFAVRNVNNVTIRDLTITNGYYDIWWGGTNGGTIERVNLTWAGNNGIELKDVPGAPQNITMTDCRLARNTNSGIYFANADHCTFVTVTAEYNGGDGFGIRWGSDGNRLERCVARQNGAYGFIVDDIDNDYNLFLNCMAETNSQHGFVIGGTGGYNQVTACTSVNHAADYAFSIWSSGHDNTFTGCLADSAFKAFDCTGNSCTFIANTARNIVDVGFQSWASRDHLYRDNVCENAKHCYAASAGGNCTYIHNVARQGRENGFTLADWGSGPPSYIMYDGNEVDSAGIYSFQVGSNCTNVFFSKNNIIRNPDRTDILTSDMAVDVSRTWWGSTDSTVVRAALGGGAAAHCTWIPYRLGMIDTTVGGDSLAPAAPDTVVVSESTASTCRITWTTVTFNEDGSACGDLAGYRIYRAQRRDTSLWVERGIVGAATTTFTDSGLTTDTGYYYRVTAYDNHATWPNESFYSDSIAGCTPAYTGPVWYVSNDTGSDALPGNGSEALPFKTIGKAIASCATGDTIRVYDGTYTQYLDVTKDSIFVIGSSRESTILNGSGAVLFYIEDQYGVTIRNFKIVSASYGIQLNHAPRTSVDSVWILNPTANAVILQQKAGEGEIYSSFTNCRFEGGGGTNFQIYVAGNSNDSITWTGNEFIGGGGHALYIEGDYYAITNNLFDNMAGCGVCYGSGHTIENNIFRNARSGEPALLLYGDGSKARNNLIDSCVGLGIKLDYATNCVIEQNTVRNCTGYPLSFAYASANDTVDRNNFAFVGTQGCSNIATSGFTFDISRNWWGTADSAAITSAMAGTTSQLHWGSWRLGEVDTRAGEDTIAPRAPDTVVVSESTVSTCRITWTTVTFNEDGSACGDLAGYRIYRAQRRDTSLWVERGITGPATTTFTDSGLTKDTDYYYRVTAFDNHATWPNESFYSDSIVTCTPTAYAGPIWYVSNDTGSDALGDGSSDSPFKTIAHAMDSCAAGDTIRVYAGTYAESVAFNKDSVAVIGAGRDLVTIRPAAGNAGAAANRANLKIRNMTFSNVTAGTSKIAWSTVVRSEITGCSFAGCGLEMSSNSCTNTVYNNIFDSGYAVLIEVGGFGNSVDSNSLTRAQSYAIELAYADSNSITNNRLQNCQGALFNLTYAADNLVSGNYLYNSFGPGFRLDVSAKRDTMFNNTCDSMTNHGILGVSADDVNYNVVDSNVFSRCLDGIKTVADTNTYRNNRIESCRQMGFWLTAGAGGNLIESNTITVCVSRGIDLTSADSNIVRSCQVSRCETGLDVSGFGNVVTQNLFDSNTCALRMSGTAAQDTIQRNNILRGDRVVNDATAGWTFDLTRNWWGTRDTATLATYMGGSAANLLSWSPFRLGAVDTGGGADVIAPAAPDTVVATAFAEGCTVTWATVTLNEDGSAFADPSGYSIYRSQSADTSDWGDSIGFVAYGTSVWTDTKVQSAHMYHYRVTAIDAHAEWPNESFYSDSTGSCTPTLPVYNGPIWYVAADTGADTICGNGSCTYPFKSIARAMDSCVAGDTIRVYAGTYTGNACFTKDTITLIGAGSNATLLNITDSYGIYIQGHTGIKVSDLRCSGAKGGGGYDTAGVYIGLGASQTEVSNLDLRDWNYGVNLCTDSATVSGCTIVQSTYYGVWIIWSRGCTVANNIIDTVGQYGIYTPNDGSSPSYDIVIDSNMIRSGPTNGIGNFKIRRARITNNVLSQAGGIVIGTDAYQDTVSGNRITNASGNGIWVGTDSNTIRDNVIDSTGTCGIWIGTGADENDVDSNTLLRSKSSGLLCAFNAGNTLRNNRIENGLLGGIYLNGIMNGVVDSNTVSGCAGTALTYINETVVNQVRYNTLTGNTGCGIELNTASQGIFTQNRIANNDSWAVYVTGAAGSDTLQRNDILPKNNRGAANDATAGAAFDLTRNWWGTRDTATLATYMSGSAANLLSWSPFRLGIVDTTPGADTIAPLAPDSVTAEAFSGGCTLVWTAPISNEDGTPLTDTAGFNVYVSRTADTTNWGDTVLTVGPATLSCTFTNLAPLVTWHFKVTCFDNHSPYPNESFYSDSTASCTPTLPLYNGPIWYVAADTGADTIAGNGSCTYPFRSIMRAMDSCAAGDTIRVYAGVYNEVVSITQDTVSLIGSGRGITGLYNSDTRGIVIAGRTGVIVRDLTCTGTSGGGTMTGVRVENASRIELSGLRLTGWDLGIDLETVDTITISGNSILSTASDAVQMTSIGNGTLYNNTVSGGSNEGIYCNGTFNDGLIDSNALSNITAHPIKLDGANRSTVSNNVISTSGFSGISLDASSSNDTITANRISNTARNGVFLKSADTCYVYNNIVDSVAEYGIQIGNYTGGNLVDSNLVTRATLHGLYLYYGTGDTFINNRVDAFGSWGARIDSCILCAAVGNTFTNGTDVACGGIMVSGRNNVVDSNIVDSCAGSGIECGFADDLTFVRYNRFSNNGSYGVLFDSSPNRIVQQNEITNNAGWAIFSCRAGDSIQRNNITVKNNKGVSVTTDVDLTRNWWGTTDTTTIAGYMANTKATWSPFRLGAVDTAPGADTISPSAPDSVSIESTAGGCTLVWTAPTTNEDGTPIAGPAGYHVYRALRRDTSNWGDSVATIAHPTTIWTDTTRASCDTYYYRVTAYDNHSPFPNESFYSDSIVAAVDSSLFRIRTFGVTGVPSGFIWPDLPLVPSATVPDTVWFNATGAGAGQADTLTVYLTGADGMQAQGSGLTSITLTQASDTGYNRDAYYLACRIDTGAVTDTLTVVATATTGFIDTALLIFVPDNTAPTLPTLLAPVADTCVTTLVFRWTASADTQAGLKGYQLQVATDTAFASLAIDSYAGAATADTHTVDGNAVYYWRVVAYDSVANACTTASQRFLIDTVPPTTPTLVSPAANTETNVSTIVFAWTAAVDTVSGIHHYQLQVSRNDTFSLLVEDTNVGVVLTVTRPLAPNDTYWWRVIAHDSAGCTAAAAGRRLLIDTAPPSGLALLAPADTCETSATTFAFRWSPATDTVTGVKQYRLQIDTAGIFTSCVYDSAQLTTTDTRTLPANCTYYWRVSVADSCGNIDTTAARRLAIDTRLALALVAPADSATQDTRPVFQWSGTSVDTYVWQLSTVASFATIHDSLTTTATAYQPAQVDSGRYYWRVSGRNAFSGTETTAARYLVVDTGLQDTTPPNPFDLASPANGSETCLTTVLFQWDLTTDSHSGIASYRLQVSKLTTFATIHDSALCGGTVSETTLTLAANDTYYWRVIAADNAGCTRISTSYRSILVDTNAPVTPTLLSPVDGVETTVTAIKFSWTDAVFTLTGLKDYRLQVSRNDKTFAAPVVDVYHAGSTETTPLYLFTASDTYYWRVYARNTAGCTSGWSAYDSFIRPASTDTTRPAPVQNLIATANADRTITLTWVQSPSSDMTGGGQYNIYWDNGTGEVNVVAPTAIVAQTTDTSYTWTTAALTSGTYYAFIVRAQDRHGNENADTAKVLAMARNAASGVPMAIVKQAQSGTRLLREQAFVTAEISPSSQLSSIARVLFQFRADTTNNNAAWDTMATLNTLRPNPATVPYGGQYAVYWDLNGTRAGNPLIADGLYQVRAVAYLTNGQSDSNPEILLVQVVSGSPSRSDTQLANGNFFAEQTVYNGTSNTTYSATDSGSCGVTLPSGAVAAATDTIRITMALAASSTPGGRRVVTSAATLTFASGQTALGGTVTVWLSYTDDNNDGVVDGTSIQASTLKLFALHTGSTTWTECTNTWVDTALKRVYGTTTSFSEFVGVGAANAGNLDNMMVAPNPFRPNGPDANQGRPYQAGVAGTGIYFLNVTQQVRIEIFTITGQKVAEYSSTNTGGTVQWDAKNEKGRDLASGYYLYLVSDPVSGQKVTGKFAVIR